MISRTVRIICPSYLLMAAGTEQHGHMSEHADNGEGNRRNALGVQHVRIVPPTGIAEDVASLSAVTSVRRQLINKEKLKENIQ